MGIMARLKSKFSPRKAGETFWLEPSWQTTASRQMQDSEAVFGAVTLLANTFAAMPMTIRKGWEEAKEHPLHRVLTYRPASGYTPYTWMQGMEVCRNATGNAYSYISRDASGNVLSLELLNPAEIEPMRDRDTGDLWYHYMPAKDAPTIYIPERSMLHVRHVTDNADKGINPLSVLAGSMEYAVQMRDFSLKQAKGIAGVLVLEVPGNPGDQRSKEIVEGFLKNYARSNNSLAVIGGGAKMSSVERTISEGRMLEVDRMMVTRASRVYGIPPAELGDYSQSSYSSQEQQQLEFLQRLIPTAKMYEAEMQMKLLTYQDVLAGYRIEIDSSGLTISDAQTRATVDQMLVRSGMMTINQGKQRNGFPPVKGGDVTFVSGDLHPLEDHLGGEADG